jgi:hypothetical protein
MGDKPYRWTVTRETANDVGVWGEKELSNADYSEPLRIAGEVIDLDALPKFGDSDETDARAPER